VDLAADESVIYRGHPSWRSILGFYIKGALLAIGAGVVAAVVSRIAEDDVKSGWVIAAVLGVLGVVLVVGWLKRLATTYTITTRRLHIQRGIVSRRNEEARLDRVQNVNTSQSVLQRVLRVGTVDFDTAGTGDSDFKFAGVADPNQIVHAIDRAHGEAAGTQPPGPSGAAA
jgi:uncharacterized membrane protein YdbT with pleckstrin-like domain